MREKWREEGGLITEGSKEIKTEIRETYIIALLSHINTDRVCENKLRKVACAACITGQVSF